VAAGFMYIHTARGTTNNFQSGPVVSL